MNECEPMEEDTGREGNSPTDDESDTGVQTKQHPGHGQKASSDHGDKTLDDNNGEGAGEVLQKSTVSNGDGRSDENYDEEGECGGGGGEADGVGDDDDDDEVEYASPKMWGFCPRWEFTVKEYLEEMKIILKLAWPNVVYMLLEAMMTIMAVLFSGHLGKNELAAASLANSITTVFTRSIGLGFSSSCDTLFTQFYGSPKKRHIGVILQRGILIMALLCFVCWGILINAETILLLAHQSSEVARLTGIYCLIYIPAVPGDYFSMLLIKYLQCQSRLKPVVITTLITNVIAACLYYLFIYVLDLRLVGTAIAQVISHYVLTALVTGYILWKKLYKGTWTGWSRDCLDDWMPIFKLGMAGCMMVCLEWWSFDVGFYLAGLLGEESIGAHAIIMYTATTGEMIPYGIGIAAAIRIGNNLGAKKPGIAHVASVASLSLGVIAAVVLAILYISLKDVIPYLFTSDSMTVKLASSILPICAMFAVMDCLATVCGGVMRGIGHQAVAAAVDFLGYYLIGLPLGISLMFPLQRGIHGFWSGMTLGIFIQALFLVVFTLTLNWKKETKKAQKRIERVEEHEDERRNYLAKSHHAASQTDLETTPNGTSDRHPTKSATEHTNGHCMKGLSSSQQTSAVTDASSNTEGNYGDDQCDGIRPVALNGYLQVRTDETFMDEPNKSANNSSCEKGNAVVSSEVSKMMESSKDKPRKTSVWELAQLRFLFLCLGFVYLGLAIVCRVLIVPSLRTTAIEREMSMANLTNVTTMFSPTDAVQYSELL